MITNAALNVVENRHEQTRVVPDRGRGSGGINPHPGWLPQEHFPVSLEALRSAMKYVGLIP